MEYCQEKSTRIKQSAPKQHSKSTDKVGLSKVISARASGFGHTFFIKGFRGDVYIAIIPNRHTIIDINVIEYVRIRKRLKCRSVQQWLKVEYFRFAVVKAHPKAIIVQRANAAHLKRRCFNIGIGDIIVDIHSNTLLTLMARFYRKVFRGLHYSKLHIVRFRVLQAMPEQA